MEDTPINQNNTFSPDQTNPTPQQPSPLAPPQPQPSKPKNNIILISIISVLSIALVVVIVLLIINLKPKDNNPNNEKIPDSPTYDYDEEYDEPNENEANISPTDNPSSNNNWQNYNFSVNGQSLSLPLSYQNLSTISGFSMKDAEAGATIAPNYYTLINLYQNNKLALSTEIANTTNDYLAYSNCQITRISQTAYMVNNGANTVTFPGNLYAGMPIDENTIYNTLGEADESKEYSGEKVYNYFTNKNWTTTNYFKIVVKNNVIDELTLDNR